MYLQLLCFSIVIILLAFIAIFTRRLVFMNKEILSIANSLIKVNTSLSPVCSILEMNQELNWGFEANEKISEISKNYNNSEEAIKNMYEQGIKKNVVCNYASEYIRKSYSATWHFHRYKEMVRQNVAVASGKMTIEEGKLSIPGHWPLSNQKELDGLIKNQMAIIDKIYK